MFVDYKEGVYGSAVYGCREQLDRYRGKFFHVQTYLQPNLMRNSSANRQLISSIINVLSNYGISGVFCRGNIPGSVGKTLGLDHIDATYISAGVEMSPFLPYNSYALLMLRTLMTQVGQDMSINSDWKIMESLNVWLTYVRDNISPTDADLIPPTYLAYILSLKYPHPIVNQVSRAGNGALTWCDIQDFGDEPLYPIWEDMNAHKPTFFKENIATGKYVLSPPTNQKWWIYPNAGRHFKIKRG